MPKRTEAHRQSRGVEVKKHFVEFLSPGTFFSETSQKEVDSWDVSNAMIMAKNITERHNAKPYGFRFITRERDFDELDSKVTETSGIYYLGGKILSLQEVKNRSDPKDKILISNMETNDYSHIIENTNSYKFTAPFDYKNDTLLPW
jgi:hypothetical protein